MSRAPHRSLAVAAIAAMVATGLYALAAPAAVASVPTCMSPGAEGVDTTTVDGTTVVVVLPSSESKVVIPAHVSQYQIDACGARGGNATSPAMNGGAGARVQATVPIAPAQQGATTEVFAVAGTPGDNGDATETAAGGQPGGGSGSPGGGGGGGFSGVFSSSTQSQQNAIVIAGGGGGASVAAGGASGGTTPLAADSGSTAGGGATSSGAGSGGGGGGYNGGAAGSSASSGGLGGSNYPAPSGVTMGTSNNPTGSVVISYQTPRAPTFTSEEIKYVAPEGMVDKWDVTVDASPVATLTLSAAPAVGSGITFEDNGDNTGTFHVSVETAPGTYVFAVHAQNVMGSAPEDQTETFTVTEPMPSPTASDTATATVSPTATATTDATSSATASASASASASTSASASASGTVTTFATCTTTSPSASPSATATATISPSPSDTATATISPCPSSSTSASATPTATIGLPILHLAVSTPDILPGQPGRLQLTAGQGSAVQLLCYSQPSLSYRQVRPGTPGQSITVGSSGTVDFSILPGTNTRCMARYANDTASGSNSVVVRVHTALSLSAYRDGPLRYHFQGRNLPRIAGQLITLYRIDARGREIRTATTKTGTTGIWRIDRRFLGSGVFRFVARTSSTMTNAAGKSNVRPTVIH